VIRVLVVDDHPVFRNGLGNAIADADITEFVGAAADGEQAIELVRTAQPDVVLMDVRMARVNGIEATARIAEESPHTNVLILSMFGDDDFVFAALRAGARGHILKEAGEREILHAIEAVAAGEPIFGAGVADRLGRFFSAPTAGRAVSRAHPSRARDPRPHRARSLQPRDRHAFHAQREDGPQLRLHNPDQAPGRPPGAGDRPRTRSGPRARLTATAAACRAPTGRVCAGAPRTPSASRSSPRRRPCPAACSRPPGSRCRR
jgi:DNA-binding NarL/FixJ family response regulator